MTASRRNKKPKGAIMTSAEIRQSYLDFFEARGHTIVPSMSLVPGGDQTLLFTNSGMVQFKDVFLGTGSRPYTRVADAQKCMRVAGKHNDLDDVGRDDTHHTFFEMLGNWSFGDYYKKEAIEWAWELLTDVWGLPKDRLWATCFEDELGEIPRDDEAASIWREQPGFNPDQVLFFGRGENFWEMAETGPCGPDSEIHLDRGPEYCNKQDERGHECRVNGDCQRFLELWNLVFIQYNRKSPTDLTPLPAKHVDTGMGFERLVSVIQDVDSNYRTDLFTPLLDAVQRLTGQSDKERAEQLTPYRVIADHARAASFLIADGVVPGNMGRNYVCRMIIRRASRFGSMIGLSDPFLSDVAEVVIQEYGGFYQELEQNRSAILRTLTEEERRFQRTIDNGLSYLEGVIHALQESGEDMISGEDAFDLYATYGLPLEITRDIARENDIVVDDDGFIDAMENHRLASGGGDAMGDLVEDNLETYQALHEALRRSGKLGEGGVIYNPYDLGEIATTILAIIKGGDPAEKAQAGDTVSVVLEETPFYVEAGGQVSDTGTIRSANGNDWLINVEGSHSPVGGLVLHSGVIQRGQPSVGDKAIASLDEERRLDIMRNHTATHLLHAALREVLGDHVRQAGSLVAPDRLRFDFTHSNAMTTEELERVEALVNQAILANHPLRIQHQKREEAISAGAMALFGEIYGDQVRTVQIGHGDPISYELCGGTHVHETSVIGSFLILQEGSVAAGIRRIEAVTGRAAQRIIQTRLRTLETLAKEYGVTPEGVLERVHQLQQEVEGLHKELRSTRKQTAIEAYQMLKAAQLDDIHILAAQIPDADADILRDFADRFRSEHPSSVVVLASVIKAKPILIAAITEDLIKRGLHAGDLVKVVASKVGGGGGGKPSMAQAGGKDPSKLPDALALVPDWVKDHLKS
jgi:alanyl-tRNA synthetase